MVKARDKYVLLDFFDCLEQNPPFWRAKVCDFVFFFLCVGFRFHCGRSVCEGVPRNNKNADDYRATKNNNTTRVEDCRRTSWAGIRGKKKKWNLTPLGLFIPPSLCRIRTLLAFCQDLCLKFDPLSKFLSLWKEILEIRLKNGSFFCVCFLCRENRRIIFLWLRIHDQR